MVYLVLGVVGVVLVIAFLFSLKTEAPNARFAVYLDQSLKHHTDPMVVAGMHNQGLVSMVMDAASMAPLSLEGRFEPSLMLPAVVALWKRAKELRGESVSWHTCSEYHNALTLRLVYLSNNPGFAWIEVRNEFQLNPEVRNHAVLVAYTEFENSAREYHNRRNGSKGR